MVFHVRFTAVAEYSDFGDDLPSGLDLWLSDEVSIPAEEKLISG